MSGPRAAIAPAPVPAPRMPSIAPMLEMPSDAGPQINDADLMTVEELAAQQTALPPMTALTEPDHNANVAEDLDDQWLDATGQKIIALIDADIGSRSKWINRFRRGLQVMGLTDFVWENGKAPFEGASTAIAPIMNTAVVQSQARLMEEVWPAAGPVKTMVMGREDEAKRTAADRVQNHMNYQLTIEDETYFMESQKLAMYLPVFGTAYRKAYHDYVLDQNLLRFVPGEDVILPYKARSLYSSPRVTHRFPVTENAYRQGVKAGAYRDIELPEDANLSGDDDMEDERKKSDSLEETVPTDEEIDASADWTFYECDLNLDVPGFEDTMDGPLDPTAMLPTQIKSGVALPWTVTLEKSSGKIVALRRNWKKDDRLKKPRVRYAEYWYLPGFGSMGMGLLHLIGTIAEAGTDALRALFDSATWANLQGGFKAKDASAKAGELQMTPGTWIDVDMTAEELSKAFHTPPFKEPSEALFKVLNLLVEMAQKFASTTDLMVGEGTPKNAPVGTTVAMIEQGSKVYSGVHKRAHFAAGIEFRMLFDLNAEFIPDEGYKYEVPGDEHQVYLADYDTKLVSVVPVSDPNIFSQTQRIALAQERYRLFKENPGDFKRTPTLRALMEALKDPEIDDTLIDWEDMPDLDPVTENAAMATAHPVKAIEGQNHDAHMAVHMAFMQHPQFGGLPQAQQVLGPAMMAHIAEHLALKYLDNMRQLGVPVPKFDTSQPAGAPAPAPAEQQVPGAQIAQMAQQMLAQFMQSSGLSTPPDKGQEEMQQLERHKLKAEIFELIGSALAKFAKASEPFAVGAQEAGAVTAAMDTAPPPGGGAPPAPVLPPAM